MSGPAVARGVAGPGLVDAVAAILARDGLAGLSISAVAGEAGLSRVTLHRRGVGLDQLVALAVARASDDLRSSLWPALTSSGDAASRLDEALRVLCEVAERHSGVLSALFHAPERPHPAEPGRTTSFDFVEPFERLLIDGNVDRSLHSAEPRTDAELLVNAVTWTYLHMRRSHRWAQHTAADRTITMATSALRASAPAPASDTRPRY